jgi:hypothetical protein
MRTEGESARHIACPGEGGLGLKALFKKGARSLGVECGRDGAGGDFASAIGHVIGHLNDIGKAGARDRAVGEILNS